MRKKRVGVLDSYHLSEALQPSARKLGERCGSSAVEMLVERLAQALGSPEDDNYSYIWRAAIEAHEQDAHRESFQGALLDVLRDVALGATSSRSEDAVLTVKTLLASRYPTLVRVGIFVCGEQYGHVGSVFWEFAKQEWFVKPVYWHELFWLIKKNFQRFSVQERNLYLKMVDELRGDWHDTAHQDEWDQSHRRDLLFPATGLGDSAVEAMYGQLAALRGPVREHPDFHSFSTRGVGNGEVSPVTSDVLVKMTADELAELFQGFKPDSRSWDSPTYRGFASVLAAAVRTSDDGFASRFSLFVHVGRPYQHGLLRGLKGRWADDKREIDWAGALGLVSSIVQSSSFKSEIGSKPQDGWEPSVHWVVGDIADLLKSGASSSERQIAPVLLEQSILILKRLLDAIGLEAVDDTTDAVSHAINSNRGKVLETTINVGLAIQRCQNLEETVPDRAWRLVGPLFESELASSEKGLNPEFAALAGMYCANLHYLNAQWVEQNFDRIFSVSDESAWRCAAEGFAYQRYLYPWLYAKLTNGGHLRRMLFSDGGLSDAVSEKALQFLGLAYLEGLEELSGKSLLDELIQTLKAGELSQLCWFFWTLRSNQKNAELVLKFWMRVADVIRERGGEHQELLSALNLLATFVEELTACTTTLWAEAAPHAKVRHHGDILVENLARLAGKHPQEVVIVFKSALAGFTPDYDPGDVIRCVEQLAEAGAVEEAEWICNEYTRRNSSLLKETYHKLRANQRVENEGKVG